MQWYYVVNDQQNGPVSDSELQLLIRTGQLSRSTLLWREGMADWLPAEQLAASEPAIGEALRGHGSSVSATVGPGGSTMIDPPGSVGPAAAAGMARCVECGLTFPTGDMVPYGARHVCSGCKDLFFQKLREGASTALSARFAGFWIRFVAKLIDSLILGAVGFVLGAIGGAAGDDAALALMVLLLPIAIQIFYYVYFHGKYGATLGKMACKIRVVRSDGSPLGYGGAFARGAAAILSSIILYVGYIIAAFDEEKRALHDRLADTRVIHV